MRIAIFLFAASAALAQTQNQTEPPIPDQNPKTSPADVEAGKNTFHSHCSPCHGYNGEGGIGPNLAAGRFYHGSTDQDLYRNISRGIAGTEMPGIFYNGDRVWQLVAFIRSLHQPDQRPEGDPTQGEAVYNSSGCANCHRVNGRGGSLGPDLSDVGAFRSAAYLRESIVSPDASVPRRYWIVTFQDPSGANIRGFICNEDTYTIQVFDPKLGLRSWDKSSIHGLTIEKKSMMPTYSGRLSDEQLQNLVAYLWTLRPAGTLPTEANK